MLSQSDRLLCTLDEAELVSLVHSRPRCRETRAICVRCHKQSLVALSAGDHKLSGDKRVAVVASFRKYHALKYLKVSN